MIAINDDQVEALALMHRQNRDGFGALIEVIKQNRESDTERAIARNSTERDEMSGRAQAWRELEYALSTVLDVYEGRVEQSRQQETPAGPLDNREPWWPGPVPGFE